MGPLSFVPQLPWLPIPMPPPPLENFPLELLTSIKSSVSRFWSVFYINRKVTNKLFESLEKTLGPIPRDSDITGLGHNLGTGNVKSVQF